MATYSFNYNQTMAQQKEVELAATELSTKCAKALADISDGVGAAWTGDSGKAFRTFLDKKREEIDLDVKNLKQIADYISRSAATLKQMEEENAARGAGV